MIAAATLDAIAATASQTPDIGSLRAAFPGLVFTACSDDDIPARVRPVRDLGSHRLYLVACPDGHCLSLTDDGDAATGVVIATCDDET